MLKARASASPKIERLSLRDFLKGTVTSRDDARTPKDGLKTSINQILSQDGTLRPRQSLMRYGEQPQGKILGEVYEFVKTLPNGSENWEISMQAILLNEVQELSISGAPTGGTFTLTYSGQTTSTIAYNASAATIQSALEALSNIAPGDVTCTGGTLPSTPVRITFGGTLANTNVTLISSTSSLTGGTTPQISVAEITPGGLQGVPHVRKDGEAWQACTGKYYHSTARAHFVQVDNKVLVMNGEDNLSYFNILTVGLTNTLVPFTQLETPNAPTLKTNTGLVGTAFKSYYRVSANSTVGETAASIVLEQDVLLPRIQWDNDHKLTIQWSAVPNAQSYNLYQGDVSGSEFLIAAGINGLEFTDDGSYAQDPTRQAPIEDSTAGPRVARGTVINGQVFFVGDKDNPRYIRFGGTGDAVLDLSPFNGGGWLELGKGSKEFPMRVMPFRDGKGNAQITVLCRGTNGRGKRYILSPNSTTIGETIINFFDVIEDNGQDGTDSPDGVILYDDSLWYPSRDGFKTTGTKPQLQNILSTNRVSNNVQPDIKSFNSKAMDLCVGLGFEGVLHWALPVGASKNTQIWTFDLDHEGAWMKWDIPADWMWLYNDNTTGDVHFCVLVNNVIYEFTRSQSTNDDGSPFNTGARSGLIKFSDDGMEWAKVIDVTFFLQRPKGDIELIVAGRTEDSPLVTVGTENFESNAYETVAGWGEAGWGAWGWSSAKKTPKSYTDPNKPITIEIDEELQWFVWQLGSRGANVDYELSDIVVRFVRIGVKDL